MPLPCQSVASWLGARRQLRMRSSLTVATSGKSQLQTAQTAESTMVLGSDILESRRGRQNRLRDL